MLFGRFVPLLAALAVAGSLAAKRVRPPGPARSAPTRPMFVVLLIGVVVLVAALTFFPALLLGPVVQGLTDRALLMRHAQDLIASAVAVVVFTVLLGLAYPLFTTGVAQVLFPNKADGSRVERDGKVVGSKLIAQDFSAPVLDGTQAEDADGKTRHGARPALLPAAAVADRLHADATYFDNLGPNQQDFGTLQATLDAYLALEPLHAGLTAADSGRRRDQLSLGRRSPHLGGQRPHPGQPHRGVRALRSTGSRS